MNPPRGHCSISRGLEGFDRRFGAGEITRAAQRHHARSPLRILEIGCGEGRALLELRRLFPIAEIHGINKHPWEAMQGSHSLIDVATFHGIFTAAELERIDLPTIHFLDAQRLPFADGTFDVVISQGAIHYVDRKDAVIEEVWRVLAPDGDAFLHIDSRLPPMPDFLDRATPRFVVYRDHELLPVHEIITEAAHRGFEISYAEATTASTSIVIRMRRNLAAPLRLGLAFDDVASFDLDVLNRERRRWNAYWGYRSVFRVASVR
ncbi:MAG TPA: class I SAM-dependent methyltransferase [Candidatus Dormibacteraeota bacterium]|nr:class I SAM-dependent methyltransferase [Candidatus Dormibacteraeota bacterium]